MPPPFAVKLWVGVAVVASRAPLGHYWERQMIVASKFPGDDDTELMWAQHDCYGPVIGYWVREATEVWFRAERLLGIQTALGDKLRAMQSFDHRSVQGGHDMLAAQFRRHVHQGRQRSLFEDRSRLTKEILAEEWWLWVREEIPRLCDDTTITRLLLEACSRPREPLGGGANGALEIALAARYDFMRPGIGHPLP